MFGVGVRGGRVLQCECVEIGSEFVHKHARPFRNTVILRIPHAVTTKLSLISFAGLFAYSYPKEVHEGPARFRLPGRSAVHPVVNMHVFTVAAVRIL
jgi:hypothetical protein